MSTATNHAWVAGKGDPTLCRLCLAVFTLEVAQRPCPGRVVGMPMGPEPGGVSRMDDGDDA